MTLQAFLLIQHSRITNDRRIEDLISRRRAARAKGDPKACTAGESCNALGTVDRIKAGYLRSRIIYE